MFGLIQPWEFYSHFWHQNSILRTELSKKINPKLNKNSYFGTEVITEAGAQSGLKFDKKNGKSNVQNYDLRCLL